MKTKTYNGYKMLTTKCSLRYVGAPTSVIINITVEEIEALAKSARKMAESKLCKRTGLNYYKHLSPDVSFFFTKVK